MKDLSTAEVLEHSHKQITPIYLVCLSCFLHVWNNAERSFLDTVSRLEEDISSATSRINDLQQQQSEQTERECRLQECNVLLEKK